MNRVLIIAFLFTVTDFLYSQQLPLFTQYRENHALINPATVNSDYMLYEYNFSMGLSVRSQWVDQKDTPRTGVFRGEYIFKDTRGTGLLVGGHLINDRTGPTIHSGAYARIAGLISDDPYFGALSVGLSVGLAQYQVKTSGLFVLEQGDILTEFDQSKMAPDVSVGVFYYKRLDNGDNIYAGISSPQIIGLDLTFRGPGRNGVESFGEFTTKRNRHLYALFGFYKFLDDYSFIEPSIWIKQVDNAPIHVDANLRYQMSKNFWIGFGGSSSKTAHGEIGVLIGDNLGWGGNIKIGYGYDYSFSSVGAFFGPSHEINIGFTLDQ